MAINLKKGGTINLNKEKPGLNNITLGLGWDVPETGATFDLDASVFILNSDGKLVSDEHFIFFNNLQSPDGAVTHTGDNRTGAGDGDDESVNIQLNKLTSDATQIVFAITIDEATKRNQDFSKVKSAFVRIYNSDTNEMFCQYYLTEKFDGSIGSDALLIARFFKSNNEWVFEAMENAYDFGLGGLVEFYQ